MQHAGLYRKLYEIQYRETAAVGGVKRFSLLIQVPDETANRIEQAAHEKGLSPNDLVRISVEEKLARDDAFEKAARHVLGKNAELYERLS